MLSFCHQNPDFRHGLLHKISQVAIKLTKCQKNDFSSVLATMKKMPYLCHN